MAENIEVAELLVKLRADYGDLRTQVSGVVNQQTDLRRAIDASQVSSDRLGTTFKALGGMAAAAAAAGGAALIGFLQSSVKEYAEAERAGAKLNAVLAATGGASGQTAASLQDYSTRMQGLTGVQDELIQSAAAVLLTFKSIKGDAFERTMTAAMDLSAVFGQSLQSSVTQLGKALENPISGMTALRRVGISFTEAEKDVIKEMVKHNQTAEAQARILQIVEGQVKGAAAALGQTLTGQLAISSAAWGDFKEMIGKVTVETLNLSWWTKQLAEALQKERDAQAAGTATSKLSAEQLKANIAQYERYAAAAKAMAQQHKGNSEAVAEQIEEYQDWTQKATEARFELEQLEGQQRRATGVMQDSTDTTRASKESIRELRAELRESATDMRAMGAAFSATMTELASPQRFVTEFVLGFGELGDLAADPFATSFSQQLGNALQLESQRTDAFGLGSALGRAMTSSAATSVGQPVKKALGDALHEGPQIPSNVLWMRQYAETLQTTLEDSLTRGLKGGLEALFRGEDFTQAWESLWNELAAIAATSMAGTIKQGLFGGSGPLGQNVQGLFGGTGTPMTTGQKLQLGGQLLGAGLMYYGQQKQDATAATAGGAISGAVSGWQMSGGNPWGAVIGAIVGGYMGWQGAQIKKTDYRLFYNPLTGKTDVDVTGYGQMEEDEMARQLYERQLLYRRQFRSLGRDLGLGSINVNQALNLSRGGEAGNFSDWWQAFISGDLPRTMWSGVSGQISGGLAGMGVGQARIKELMDAFSSGTFDTALADLQAFVTALVGLRDVSDLLGMTPDELRAEVNMTMREGFLRGFEETMDDVADLMDGVDKLYSQEQVANAEKLVALAQTQYDAGLRYFSQLEQMRQSISTSFEDIFLGFDEQRAKEGGTLGQFYSGQITDLLEQLRNASSAEEVQRLVSRIQQYGGSLWEMGDNWADWGNGRAQTEEWLREAQRLSDEKLKAWEDEVALKNEELRAQIDAMTAALAGASTGAGAATDGSTSLAQSTNEASGAVDHMTLAVDQATASVVQLGEWALRASTALSNLSSTASATTAGWN